MIISQIDLNGVYDSGCPFYDKRLEAILLVKIGIHELLHRFNGET
jgi:hypothetical protein